MVGNVLTGIQSVVGPPTRERKTIVGKFLQRMTTGSNFVAPNAAPPIQQRPLASGNISFGNEQRNRNLLNIVALVVVAILGWRFLGKKGRRR